MPGRIDDPDRDDSTDTSLNGLVARLGAVARIQTKQNERLTAISGHLGNPPEPIDGARITDQTAAIRLAANATLGLLDEIDKKATRPS